MLDPKQLYEAIIKGDAARSKLIAEEMLAGGIDPQELVTNHMIPAMDEVGRRFEANECFVPELLIAGRAMKGALEIIRPLLAARGAQPIGRVVIGTVRGDLHDIGKNLVAAMLEGGGFEVVDVGADAAPEKFIEVIKQQNVSIVALSALLTTTMLAMKTTIEALKSAGVRDRVKVMVGGAPITEQFARDIGADGYSSNANNAVALARKFVGVSI